MLMLSFAIGIGVGLNALLSKTLGTKNITRARQVIQTGYFQALLSTSCFVMIGLFFSKAFISLFTNSEDIINMDSTYLKVCFIGSFGIFASTTGERILQATGNSILSMICQITGAVINIVLDFIFIYVFHLQIFGVAIATVLSQWLSASLTFCMNLKFNNYLMKDIKQLHFQKELAKLIYKMVYQQ